MPVKWLKFAQNGPVSQHSKQSLIQLQYISYCKLAHPGLQAGIEQTVCSWLESARTDMQTCLFVIALRCFSSSVGRYMMTPTQLNRVSGGSSGVTEAGLRADLLLEVHRCSIGLGAGMPCLSIRDSNSST